MIIIPLISGPAAYLIAEKRESFTDVFACMAALCEFVLSIALFFASGQDIRVSLFSIPLSFDAGGLHSVYAFITAFMWLATEIFAKEYFDHERDNLGRYQMFMLMTLSATQGVMLSADLMTAFIFFEILSFTSFTWVIHEQSREAVRAAYTYLYIAVFGGMILFAGLAMLSSITKTLSFAQLADAVNEGAAAHPVMLYASGLCILLGFGAKAGMFPLHIWLPMAHPIAPSPASALLSGVLTKVGIYGIIACATYVMQGQPGFGFVVLTLGLITMVTGAVMALLSENLKRTLACSSMSQIGFILTGIAMMVIFSSYEDTEGGSMAYAGVALHMINHSLIKLALFCAAGVVVMNIHKLSLYDIRGFGRRHNILKAVFLVGALGISGVPLFNGYISKTLLHESITEASLCLTEAGITGAGPLFLAVAEWIFIISGGLTFAYMLRLFVGVFVSENADAKIQESYDGIDKVMSPVSAAVLIVSAAICFLLGQPPLAGRIAAYITGGDELLSYDVSFSSESLTGAAISLAIGFAVYFVIVRNLEKRRYAAKEKKEKDESLKHAFMLFPAAIGHALAFIIRALNLALEGPVELIVSFLHYERKKETHHTRVYSVFDLVLTGRRDESALSGSFSLALMMTCIGILIILFVLLFTML